MSAHHAERIYKPPFFGIKHLKQGRGDRTPYIIGFDSEAHSCDMLKHRRCRRNGYPVIYQFAHPDGRVDIIPVPDTGRRYETFFTFARYLWDVCKRKDEEYLVFGYNLQYEYTQLFRDLARELKEAGEFRLGVKPYEPCILPIDNIPFYVSAMNEKRYSFTLEWAHTKRRVRVLDVMAFLPGGLDGAAKMVGVGRKTKAVPFDGMPETPEQWEYARQDALLTQTLGAWVIDLHERYDVTLTISAPHFASKVYKRSFLKTEIPLPSSELEQDGLRSYHGGKNGYYKSRPYLLPNVWHVDIRSAYPEAMRALPDIENSEWIFSDRYIRGEHALWRVRGTYKRCRYRSLMHDTGWPNSGRIDIVTTGYELDSAVSHGEITIEKCEGWLLRGRDGGSLTEYVDTFYAQKSTAKTQTERIAAKLFLNSLYGKFFQKVPQGDVGAVDMDTGQMILTDPTQEYDYVAGGLYHPPIASLITGFVRAKIHGLEHRFKSIMTSTDGFFCVEPPPPEMLGKGLGMLSAERGKLKILRERAYVFDPDIPEHDDECTSDCQNPHPIYALHGFWGTLEQLRDCPLTPGNVYHYISKPKPVLLRESTRTVTHCQCGIPGRHGHAPGEFLQTERAFQLPGPAP